MRIEGSLPDYLAEQPEVQAIQAVLLEAAQTLRVDIDDTVDQLFVQRADWGLLLWEMAFGLSVSGSKNLEERRGRILAKLRGQGTSTAELIKTLVMSFGLAAVEILEHVADHCFEVCVFGLPALPSHLGDIRAAIEEVKPAHLSFFFSLQTEPFRTDCFVGGACWTVTECTLPPLSE